MQRTPLHVTPFNSPIPSPRYSQPLGSPITHKRIHLFPRIPPNGSLRHHTINLFEHSSKEIFWDAVHDISTAAVVAIAAFAGIYLLIHGHTFAMIVSVLSIMHYGFRGVNSLPCKGYAKEHHRWVDIANIYKGIQNIREQDKRTLKAHEEYWRYREEEHLRAAARLLEEINTLLAENSPESDDLAIAKKKEWEKESEKEAKSRLKRSYFWGLGNLRIKKDPGFEKCCKTREMPGDLRAMYNSMVLEGKAPSRPFVEFDDPQKTTMQIEDVLKTDSRILAVYLFKARLRSSP